MSVEFYLNICQIARTSFSQLYTNCNLDITHDINNERIGHSWKLLSKKGGKKYMLEKLNT